MIVWAVRKFLAWRMERRIAAEERERRQLEKFLELVKEHIAEHEGLRRNVRGSGAHGVHREHVQAHGDALRRRRG